LTIEDFPRKTIHVGNEVFNKTTALTTVPLQVKLKYKKYHTVGSIPKSNRKIVKGGKIDTPNTQIHDRSRSWLGIGTSIKLGVV